MSANRLLNELTVTLERQNIKALFTNKTRYKLFTLSFIVNTFCHAFKLLPTVEKYKTLKIRNFREIEIPVLNILAYLVNLAIFLIIKCYLYPEL